MELTSDDIERILSRGSSSQKKWLWKVKNIIENDNYIFKGIVSGMPLDKAMKTIESKSIPIGRWTVKQLLYLTDDMQLGYEILNRYWFSNDRELLQLQLFQENETRTSNFIDDLDSPNFDRVEEYESLFDGAHKYPQE